MLCNQRDYCRAVITSWLVNAHQSLQGHPLAELRRVALTLWNEEQGEVSLSMLAQTNALHTNRTNIDQLSTQYKLMKHQRGPITSIPGLERQTSNKDQPVSRTGGDVIHAVTFMATLIRELEAKTLTEYTGQRSEWTNKLIADGSRQAVQRFPWSKLGQMDCLEKHLGDIKRLVITGTWEVEPDAWQIDNQNSDSDGDLPEAGLDYKYTQRAGIQIR
jgi:hypothetical protein